MKIIDVHAHLGKVMHGYPPLTVEKLLRFMDAHDIEWSVVLPLVHPEEEDYYYTTEQALADCARHPDRLIPFANIDPRRSSNDAGTTSTRCSRSTPTRVAGAAASSSATCPRTTHA